MFLLVVQLSEDCLEGGFQGVWKTLCLLRSKEDVHKFIILKYVFGNTVTNS